jgi:hypothetical protein
VDKSIGNNDPEDEWWWWEGAPSELIEEDDPDLWNEGCLDGAGDALMGPPRMDEPRYPK